MSLWNHVRVVVQDPPPPWPDHPLCGRPHQARTSHWDHHQAPTPAIPGLTRHKMVTWQYHLMDCRGLSAFTLTKRLGLYSLQFISSLPSSQSYSSSHNQNRSMHCKAPSMPGFEHCTSSTSQSPLSRPMNDQTSVLLLVCVTLCSVRIRHSGASRLIRIWI